MVWGSVGGFGTQDLWAIAEGLEENREMLLCCRCLRGCSR